MTFWQEATILFLNEEGTDDKVLSAAEAEELTLRFLFGDSAGPKATGPNGAASHNRSTLKLL